MKYSLRFICIAALAAALGCGGFSITGGSGGNAVATVTVTLPAALLIGDTVLASAEARDASGNRLVKSFSWTSSNPAVVSVSPAGLMVGVAVGGPVTITATADGKSGTGSLSVADDTRIGYALADQPSVAGAYAPGANYRFNSSGGAIQVTRSGTGVYSVRFAGLGRLPGERDNAQVTAFGGDNGYCKLGGWQSAGADMLVEVRCFAQGGPPVDHRFTVLLTGAHALPGRFAFLLSDNPPGSGPLDPATVSTPGVLTDVHITRDSAGSYKAYLGVPRVAGSGHETVMVTAVGTGPERCSPDWDETVGVALLECNAGLNNTFVDTRFSVLWVERGRAGQRAGYAFANENSNVGDYTPPPNYSYNSSGGTIIQQHPAAGHFNVIFGGLAKLGAATETVMIMKVINPGPRCGTSGWANSGVNDLTVNVVCWLPNGTPADAAFVILLIQ
jgi:Big-like domain-containing protein